MWFLWTCVVARYLRILTSRTKKCQFHFLFCYCHYVIIGASWNPLLLTHSLTELATNKPTAFSFLNPIANLMITLSSHRFHCISGVMWSPSLGFNFPGQCFWGYPWIISLKWLERLKCETPAWQIIPGWSHMWGFKCKDCNNNAGLEPGSAMEEPYDGCLDDAPEGEFQ